MRLLRRVAGVEKKEAIRRQPVAASPSGLLVVALDVFRQVVVDNPAHVRFVDPHPERNRRADDPDLVPQKKLLVFRTLSGREPRMVGARGEPPLAQACGQPVRSGPGRAIDDPAIHRTPADKLGELPHSLVLGDHAIREVRAVEAGDKNGGVAELEMPDNVHADPLGGGRGERGDGHIRQQSPQAFELAVFRAKIVPPFRDAVRLVNREGGDVPGAEVLLPVVEHQPLGSGVEQAELSLVQPAQAGF